jgi:XapX domain-containing protein
MGRTIAAMVIAFGIGSACRWLDIPLPAPPTLLGVVLILCITVGYIVVDVALSR